MLNLGFTFYSGASLIKYIIFKLKKCKSMLSRVFMQQFL